MGPRSLSQGSLLWVESDQTKYRTEVPKRPISLKFYRNFTSVIDNAIITSKKVAVSSCSAQERKLIVFRRQRPLWHYLVSATRLWRRARFTTFAGGGSPPSSSSIFLSLDLSSRSISTISNAMAWGRAP